MSKTRHGLCIYVENEFGVIQRVTNLFSARGMSIDSIHTTPIDVVANVSQISIALLDEIDRIELMQKLLMRTMIVHEVRHIEIPTLERPPYSSQVFSVHEDCIPKVAEIVKKYDLQLFQVYSNAKIHCVTGTEKTIDAFVRNIKDVESLVLIKKFRPF